MLPQTKLLCNPAMHSQDISLILHPPQQCTLSYTLKFCINSTQVSNEFVTRKRPVKGIRGADSGLTTNVLRTCKSWAEI